MKNNAVIGAKIAVALANLKGITDNGEFLIPTYVFGTPSFITIYPCTIFGEICAAVGL